MLCCLVCAQFIVYSAYEYTNNRISNAIYPSKNAAFIAHVKNSKAI